MSIAILDGTKEDEVFNSILVEELERAGEELEILKLEKMHIEPCRNCGACNDKTPGACIQKDDTPQLIRALVNSDRWGILTHLSFGGYSSVTKKALDKLSLLGIPTFIVQKGRLQHAYRYPVKVWNKNMPCNVVIAITNSESEFEKQCFEKLVKANSRILMFPFKLIFIDVDEDKNSIREKMINLFKGE